MVNNRTCSPTFDHVLLLATRGDLRRISFDTPDFSDVEIVLDDGDRYSDHASVMMIDYDPVEGFMYWTDQYKGIYRATLDGKRHERFINDGVSRKFKRLSFFVF